jgi:hypothetical protein
VIAEKLISQRFGCLAMVSNAEDFIFYFFLLGLLIKWLDDATHPNHPHQKKGNDPLL